MLRLLSFLQRMLGRKPRQQHRNIEVPQIDQIYFQGKNYPVEKQAEIEDPCQQLFRQKESITSGRLQLIGLGKIKKRMGSAWADMKTLVYTITELIIKQHITGDDVFIRYKDDTYVIIFSHASYEEGEKLSVLIVDGIRERLFATHDKNLQDIEIQTDVIVFKTAVLAEKPLTEALDMMFTVFKTKVLEESAPLATSLSEEEEGGEEEQEIAPVSEIHAEYVDCAYIPLWDAQKKVLTAYLLLPQGMALRKDIFSVTQAPDTAIDLNMLKTVQTELRKQSSKGKQPLIICPIRHEALYKQENYKK